MSVIIVSGRSHPPALGKDGRSHPPALGNDGRSHPPALGNNGCLPSNLLVLYVIVCNLRRVVCVLQRVCVTVLYRPLLTRTRSITTDPQICIITGSGHLTHKCFFPHPFVPSCVLFFSLVGGGSAGTFGFCADYISHDSRYLRSVTRPSWGKCTRDRFAADPCKKSAIKSDAQRDTQQNKAGIPFHTADSVWVIAGTV